jgi:hypothetical protein
MNSVIQATRVVVIAIRKRIELPATMKKLRGFKETLSFMAEA